MSQRNDNESAILGAALMDNAVLDDGRITEELFVNQEALFLLRTMRGLRDAGKPVTILTLFDESKGKVEASYLGALSDKARGANLDWYLEQLREDLRMRIIRKIKFELESGIDKGEESEKILDKVEREIFSLRSKACDMADVDVNAMLHDIIDLAGKRASGEIKGPLGLVTGFDNIDRLTGGFQRECLYLIAARTSVGKTALALSMTDYQLRQGKKVAFASLEMSGRQVTERLLAARSRVPSHRLRYGNLASEDFAAMMIAAGPLGTDPLMVLDKPGLSMKSLRAWVRAAVGKGAEILYLDYVGLIAMEGDRPRWERMAEVSSTLKELARELKIPVVALVQLNRSAAEDDVPGLHQLRDSGSLEQDADAVMLLYRPSKEKDVEGEIAPGTLYLAKNRSGPTGKVKLDFHRSTCSFTETMELSL